MSFGLTTAFPAYAPVSSGASLNLDFMGGTLAPSITFTRTTTATYVNSAGLVTTAAIDTPRFDYNPVTLALKGLLIEEGRTNLLTYSEQFENVIWAKSNTTVTADAAVSPDGSMDADKLVEAATTAEHNIIQAATYTSGTTYSFSMYAKQGERGFLCLSFGSAAFGGVTRAWFDLTTGTVGTLINSPIASITPAGNGWYRCTLTKTATSTVATNTIAIVTNADSVLSYTGNGTSGIYIWGAQLEAGATPSSYIPTVAASVGRGPDVAVMTGTDFSSWYNATEGSFLCDFLAGPSISSTRVLSASSGSSSNSVGILGSNAGSTVGPYAQVSVLGVVQATLAIGAPVANALEAISFGYKLNSFAAARNGVLSNLDNLGTIPTGLTQLNIGSDASAYLNGYVQRIIYYPTRLANTELQTLTV